jgi:hemolysin III
MNPKVKPRFRGVSHQFAFFVSLVAGALLVAAAPPGVPRTATAVFAVSLSWLLGVSALYHRPMWPPATRAKLRRLDHASIFLLIAGTYTPFCLIVLQGTRGRTLLIAVWSAAIIGAVVVALWPTRPRILSSTLYVTLGLAALLEIRAIVAALSTASLVLFALGGVFYISGAIIYALRRPDPRPDLFGYHEVFHALVVAACAMHFAAVVLVIRALAPTAL